MIDFRRAEFVTSSASPSFKGKLLLPEVVFIGRTNVGKSTLINAIAGKKIAFSSKKAGKTKSLNYFLIDRSFYLVDAPGYGKGNYATDRTIHFSKMMEELSSLSSLKGIVCISDLRHEPGKEDKEFVSYLHSLDKPIIHVVSKSDLLNQSSLSKAKRYAGEMGIIDPIFSKLDQESLRAIRKRIVDLF